MLQKHQNKLIKEEWETLSQADCLIKEDAKIKLNNIKNNKKGDAQVVRSAAEDFFNKTINEHKKIA